MFLIDEARGRTQPLCNTLPFLVITKMATTLNSTRNVGMKHCYILQLSIKEIERKNNHQVWSNLKNLNCTVMFLFCRYHSHGALGSHFIPPHPAKKKQKKKKHLQFLYATLLEYFITGEKDEAVYRINNVVPGQDCKHNLYKVLKCFNKVDTSGYQVDRFYFFMTKISHFWTS